jgi:hypothetical protein
MPPGANTERIAVLGLMFITSGYTLYIHMKANERFPRRKAWKTLVSFNLIAPAATANGDARRRLWCSR